MRLCAHVLVMACAGCGRVNFEEHGDAAIASDAIRPQALVGDILYFSFDGATPMVDHARGVIAQPSVAPATMLVSGRYGSGVQTSGSAYLVLGDDPLYTDQPMFTFEAWVERAVTACSGVFGDFTTLDANGLVTERSWELTGTLAMRYNANDGTSLISHESGDGMVSTGDWHHIAYVWTGAELIYYVDGAVVASEPLVGASQQRSAQFVIGARANLACTFSGVIDELKLSSFAKTAAEIAASMAYVRP